MKYYTDNQSQLAMINGDNHNERPNPCPVQPTLTTAPCLLHTELFLARGLLFSSTESVFGEKEMCFLDVIDSLEHLHHTNQQIISEKECTRSKTTTTTKKWWLVTRWGGGNPTVHNQRCVWFPKCDQMTDWEKSVTTGLQITVMSYYYGIYEHFSAAFYHFFFK